MFHSVSAVPRGRGECAPGPRIAGRTIGIDPGLERTGYAVVAHTAQRAQLVDAGVIRLDPRRSLHQRLADLAADLESLIRAHEPALLACEQLYSHYRHPRTAILMAHARGVVLAMAARENLRVLSVPATHVKKWLTGNGRAAKAQVQKAVMNTLGLTELPGPYDVSDAIGVALSVGHEGRG